MGKDRGPRKRKAPAPKQAPVDDEPIERATRDQMALVPPPPPPPPAPQPEQPPRRSVQSREFAALVEFVHALRAAVESLLDLADAAAEAITRRERG